MPEQDLYEILGVSRDATQGEIKRAYKKLARQLHPDLNPGDDQAEERFKEVSAAYDVLGDPEQRELYDEFGADATKVGFDPDKARAYQQWQQRSQAAEGFGAGPQASRGFDFGDLGDLGDLFGGAFGGRSRRWRTAPRKGADVESEITVGFLDAALGGKREIRLSDPRTGQTEHLAVTIPRGVGDGQKIRLAGKGGPGANGGPPGDLYLTIHVAGHPVFRREGLDIHLDVPITIKEAMLGGKVDVPTLEGRARVSVPPGSQSGQKLRLRGKGIRGRKRTGDLYADLQVRVPEGVDPDRVRELVDEIETLYDGDVRRELAEAT